ncbi:MAG: hypothetical protein EVJ47_08185 [Candidatus Acidulodesulfobacterium ferriphilum]|uniref:Uncharacterized protein n=1 Tax=Candidatus Acidulodesulfobacterium ferriphilum TaxID=2597223 RepID=A0A519B9C6_9DELT|nr:MAG: hypothetical protein EVJ47_08185 [Candidatus Acidulodesulfobacterium ferriphilum]
MLIFNMFVVPKEAGKFQSKRSSAKLNFTSVVRHIFSPARLFLHVENAGEDGEAVIHYKYLDLFNKNNFIYKRLRD